MLLRKNPQLLASTPPTPFQVLPVGSALHKLSGLRALCHVQACFLKVCSPGGGGGGGLRPWSLAGKSGRRGLLVIQIPGSTWRGGWRHDSDILPVSLAQLTVEREVAGSRLHSPKPGLSCDVALCGPDLEVLKDGSRFSALFLRRPELCLRWKINILLPASYFLHLVLV